VAYVASVNGKTVFGTAQVDGLSPFRGLGGTSLCFVSQGSVGRYASIWPSEPHSDKRTSQAAFVFTTPFFVVYQKSGVESVTQESTTIWAAITNI
jgi:hypothetical protein